MKIQMHVLYISFSSSLLYLVFVPKPVTPLIDWT